MAVNTLANFPVLTSTNFNNWKFRITSLLEKEQVNEVLDQDIPAQEDERKVFQVKDAKARAFIIQGISDKHLDIVKDAKTAREMIKALQDIFVRSTTFSKLALWRKLFSLKLRQEDSLDDHFLKFDSLIRELEECGSKLDESDRICHLLLSLNSNYDVVITALETLPDLKMDFVKSRLLDEEMKVKSKTIEGSASGEVSFAARSGCFICGDKSHYKNRCPRRFRRGRGAQRGGRNYNEHKQNNVDSSNKTAEKGNFSEISFIALSCNNRIFNDTTFILDSGASENLIKGTLENKMTDISTLEKKVLIKIANGDVMVAEKKGKLQVQCQGRKINIEALIVHGLNQNLLSVSKLTSKGHRISVDENCMVISGHGFNIMVNHENGLYTLETESVGENSLVSIAEKEDLWHRRLGHLSKEGLQNLGLPFPSEKCSTCIEAKGRKLPFFPQGRKTKHIGELIHTDICGPVDPVTMNGEKYFQVILDDFSHFVVVKLLKCKSEAEQNLIDYIKELENMHGTRVKRIRSDCGGEFTSNSLKDFVKSKGIKMEYTISHNPQMNGKSERMNGVLLNMVRCKLVDSKVPRYLWGEALRTSAYELNRSPSNVLEKCVTPATLWHGRNDLNKVKIFGCRAWTINQPRGSKLDPRAKKGVMIGYCGGGYRLWFPDSDKILRCRHVTFDEEIMECKRIEQFLISNEKLVHDWSDKNQESDDNKIIQSVAESNVPKTLVSNEEEEEENSCDSIEEKLPTTSSGRVVRPPSFLNDYEIFSAYCFLSVVDDPETFEEAAERKEWIPAIENELRSHEKLNTWTPTELPQGKLAIDTRWIFRTKEDGTKKARLVAKGFQQTTNDEEFVYSPVCRMQTIRILFSQAIQNDWPLRQIDVPTAFLNGVLEEEVYIKRPLGVNCNSDVLKLNRALYGLKGAPRCWNNKFTNVMDELGFKRSKFDFCLYSTDSVYLVLFVDDAIVTGQNSKVIEVIEALKRHFNIKDLGDAVSFLGMSLTREGDTLNVKQTKIIERLLTEFKMEECKGVRTPMEPGFDPNGECLPAHIPYRRLVCSLMYIALTTRPDIMFSVSHLSRYLDNPTFSTWKAAKRILRYLQATKNFALLFKRNSNEQLEGFSDADWAGDKQTRKSVSGFFAMYLGNPVSWFSKKQTCVALSTAESEYIAAAAAGQELVNLRGVISDFVGEKEAVLRVDNKSAISMIKTFENSKRSKHIDIRQHFIKDLCFNKILDVNYISSEENVADLFTKALVTVKFEKLRQMINVCNVIG